MPFVAKGDTSIHQGGGREVPERRRQIRLSGSLVCVPAFLAAQTSIIGLTVNSNTVYEIRSLWACYYYWHRTCDGVYL